MPPKLRNALTPVLVMILSSLATKLHIDARDQQGEILSVATAIAAVIVAGCDWLARRIERKKIVRAEAIVPGITSIPKGSETVANVSVNDPKTDDAPSVIINATKNTP